jgi:hypothetical protein
MLGEEPIGTNLNSFLIDPSKLGLNLSHKGEKVEESERK